MKKIAAVFIPLMFLSLNLLKISALEFDMSSIGGDFTVYSEDPAGTSEILGTDQEQLADTVKENNLIFLAVDSENKRQIQISCDENDFSHSVINLSNLTDDSIYALMPDIIGDDSISGEIVNSGGQKYVRVDVKTENSDNGFFLTRFFTVADRKNYSVSFYTAPDQSRDYIGKIFPVTSISPSRDTDTDIKKFEKARLFVIIGITVLGGISLWLIFYILKDLLHHGSDDDAKPDDDDFFNPDPSP